jgi:hypothetical protein
MSRRKMQNQPDKQTTFFDLALQQHGTVNTVLETIAREVDFTDAERRWPGLTVRLAVPGAAWACCCG